VQCLPKNLAVHRIEGGLNVYVSHMQGLSKFSMQLGQETLRQYGVDCRATACEAGLRRSLLMSKKGLQPF